MFTMESVKQKSGIFLIDKNVGPTSRQVVNSVSYLLHNKKVGHVGTLDPFASGLLILTINHGTKIGAYLEALDKTYVATIKLGEKTNTGDLTGEIIDRKVWQNSLLLNDIKAIMASFIGKRTQIPPMFSALKRDGKPLYKYAREGKILERQPRNIEIFEMRLLSLENDMLTFSTRVSKGTYVRTLAEEIAEALGTVGHLISLRRVAIGTFKVANALQVSDLSFENIIPITQALMHIKQIEVKEDVVADIKNGKSLRLNCDNDIVLLLCQNVPLALYEKRDDGLYYSRRGLF
jgi:tRNA pseudouridine55 synthase